MVNILIEFEFPRFDHSISDVQEESFNQYAKKVKDKSSKLTLAIRLKLSNK